MLLARRHRRSLSQTRPIPLNSATTVQAMATAASHTASTVANHKLQIPNTSGLLHANGDSHRDRGGIKQVVAVERELVDAGCELAGARYVNLLTIDHS